MSNDAASLRLSPTAKALTALSLALGTFMQVLDLTIANVSVPTIAGNLGVAASQGTWVITSFAVANGISVPLTGWLMQRYGVVRTFAVSVALFTIASFFCGIAWSLPSLIVFRALQGAVSGPMIPGSQALLLSLFSPNRQRIGLVIWSMTMLVAPICGPLLGGYISDNWSWPWIFLMNVPVGVFAAIVCWRNLRSQETATRKVPIDGIGLGLLIVWVGALQIALDTGKDADWFESWSIIALSLVAAVGFVAWLIWESTEQHPMVDLTLFKLRNFTFGTLVYSLGYAVFFGNLILLPLWLQTQLGYTATWAGLVVVPAGIVSVLLSPVVARLLDKIDARFILTVALCAFGVSFLMRSGYTAQASFRALSFPLLIQGIGMATLFVAALAILLDRLPAERIPAATGMSNFIRITAGSFATSITTTYWDRHAALNQTQLAEIAKLPAVDGDTLNRLGIQLGSEGVSQQQFMGLMTRELVGQSYLLSALDFFWISGWLMFALIALVWFTRRPAAGTAAAATD